MFSAVGFHGITKYLVGSTSRTAARALASSSQTRKAWSQWSSSQPSSRRLINEKSTTRPTASCSLPPPAASTSTSTR